MVHHQHSKQFALLWTFFWNNGQDADKSQKRTFLIPDQNYNSLIHEYFSSPHPQQKLILKENYQLPVFFVSTMGSVQGTEWRIGIPISTGFKVKDSLQLNEQSCHCLFQLRSRKQQAVMVHPLDWISVQKKKSVLTEQGWAIERKRRQRNIYLSIVTFGTSTESELCTSLNPQPGSKYIFVWPYHSLNRYNILICSLPDIPYDAL